MTAKADYTEEEWARLRRAPLVAGLAISIADPGGPIEAVKETSAALKVAGDPAMAARDDLLGAVAQDLHELARQRQNPLHDFKLKGATAGKQVLDELGAVNAVLTAKATPEEATAFRAWIVEAAQHAADAAKEGGFLGFKAERVSQGERDMLDEIGRALGVSAG